MTYSIVTLPGDGTGPEVLAQGLRVLRAAAELLGLSFDLAEVPCGGKYYLEHAPRDWPEGAEDRCARADLLLLGAVGWPAPDGKGPVTMADGKMAGYSAVIGNRTRLDLYANVRPVKLYPGVQHRIHGKLRSVWEPARVDFVVVRENTEGLYAGMGGILAPGGRAEVATDTRVITRRGAERVIRFAYELCRRRGRGAPADGKMRLTCIAKDNVLRGCQMFNAICREIAAAYPDVETEFVLVDSFTMFVLTQPEHYDVCVTTNLFGDIVTDLASVLQGGMGMAVGGNIGDGHAMFEPIHGSAPPLAGKDQANPMATVLAVADGLRWLGARKADPRLTNAGDGIERAVVAVLERGGPLTFDLAPPGQAAKCSEVGSALVEEVGRQLRPAGG
jgi:isocitrate/isopropylmalate dehydrogenase